MLTYLDLQNEVKRRATRDQSGTSYDTAVKNLINTALFRISRESSWRQLRRKSTITTVTSYTEGTGAATVTEDSTAFSVTGATFLTDGILVGRYIKFGGSTKYYKIDTITSETEGTLDKAYDGDDATDESYEIMPQEEYNLPVQVSHRMFMWHREWGYPRQLSFVTDQTFYGQGIDDITIGIPTHYKMWGENMVKEQPLAAGALRVYSSDADDKSISITIFGTVGGYPDYEVIATNASNGTTATSGSKSFTYVERVVKNAVTEGTITIDANSANTTIAVIPVGDTTAGILYHKVQLYPLPNSAFDINVWYYKDPYRLVNDTDVHELGQEFDESIILLATAKMRFESNQEEGDKWFALYKDELKSLKRTNVDKMDWFPKLDSVILRSTSSVHPFLSYQQIGTYYGPSSR